MNVDRYGNEVQDGADENYTPRGLSAARTYATSPAQMQAEVTYGKQKIYDEVYTPVERSLLSRVNSTDLIDAAKKDLDANQQDLAGQRRRQMARHNFNPGAAASAENNNTASTQTALSRANTMNNARATQRDTNRSLLQSLIGVGRNIEGSATDLYGSLAEADAARESANAQAKSAAKQANQSTNASIASAMILAYAFA